MLTHNNKTFLISSSQNCLVVLASAQHIVMLSVLYVYVCVCVCVCVCVSPAVLFFLKRLIHLHESQYKQYVLQASSTP